MTRILAIADQVEERLDHARLRELRPDLVLSAGDLPYGYLDFIVSSLDVPLLYVPGNHDPELRPPAPTLDAARSVEAESLGPAGCENLDGRIVDEAGLRIAGLGGSIRYNRGPNQYTQAEMRRRVLWLEFRARLRRLRDGRLPDVILTHSPPLGIGDGPDPAHQGFAAFLGLIKLLRPRLFVHGHVHPYGNPLADHKVGRTTIVNAVGYRLLDT